MCIRDSCHLFAAGFITLAATRTDYNSLYTLVLLSVMFYMPTIALSNSVAYNALEKAGLDTVTHFPPIRVWGTVGFICAMWVVDLGKMGLSATQLYFSATLGLILGLYSFTLPNCPINRSGGGKSIEMCIRDRTRTPRAIFSAPAPFALSAKHTQSDMMKTRRRMAKVGLTMVFL